MNAKERRELNSYMRLNVKGYDDAYRNQTPSDEYLDYYYHHFPQALKSQMSRRKFELLFKLRLSHYRETKKG